MGNSENNCQFTTQCLFCKSTNKRWQGKLPPQTSPLSKKHYPVRTTAYLGILLETRRGNGQCKLIFDKAVILKRILNIFKLALTGLPCNSNLSENAVFYSLFIFCWNFLNFLYTKNNFRDFVGKKLKKKQFKQDWKKQWR